MPMIRESDPFTVVMEYEVEQGRQQEMIDAVTALVRRHIRHDPAFISASFHAHEDGRRVMNYAQWTSRTDWEQSAAQTDPELRARFVAAVTGCGGTRTRLDFLKVTRVVERAGMPVVA